MKRISIALLCASLVAVASNACDEGDAYYSSYGPAYSDHCATYTSCGSCTPVLGCGWCFEAKGDGECVAGPSLCSGSAFSWTWEKSGCHLPADAGVRDAHADSAVSTPVDAAPPVAEDAAPPVAEDAASDAQPADDAGSEAVDATPN